MDRRGNPPRRQAQSDRARGAAGPSATTSSSSHASSSVTSSVTPAAVGSDDSPPTDAEAAVLEALLSIDKGTPIVDAEEKGLVDFPGSDGLMLPLELLARSMVMALLSMLRLRTRAPAERAALVASARAADGFVQFALGIYGDVLQHAAGGEGDDPGALIAVTSADYARPDVDFKPFFNDLTCLLGSEELAAETLSRAPGLRRVDQSMDNDFFVRCFASGLRKVLNKSSSPVRVGPIRLTAWRPGGEEVGSVCAFRHDAHKAVGVGEKVSAVLCAAVMAGGRELYVPTLRGHRIVFNRVACPAAAAVLRDPDAARVVQRLVAGDVPRWLMLNARDKGEPLEAILRSRFVSRRCAGLLLRARIFLVAGVSVVEESDGRGATVAKAVAFFARHTQTRAQWKTILAWDATAAEEVEPEADSADLIDDVDPDADTEHVTPRLLRRRTFFWDLFGEEMLGIPSLAARLVSRLTGEAPRTGLAAVELVRRDGGDIGGVKYAWKGTHDVVYVSWPALDAAVVDDVTAATPHVDLSVREYAAVYGKAQTRHASSSRRPVPRLALSRGFGRKEADFRAGFPRAGSVTAAQTAEYAAASGQARALTYSTTHKPAADTLELCKRKAATAATAGLLAPECAGPPVPAAEKKKAGARAVHMGAGNPLHLAPKGFLRGLTGLSIDALLLAEPLHVLLLREAPPGASVTLGAFPLEPRISTVDDAHKYVTGLIERGERWEDLVVTLMSMCHGAGDEAAEGGGADAADADGADAEGADADDAEGADAEGAGAEAADAEPRRSRPPRSSAPLAGQLREGRGHDDEEATTTDSSSADGEEATTTESSSIAARVDEDKQYFAEATRAIRAKVARAKGTRASTVPEIAAAKVIAAELVLQFTHIVKTAFVARSCEELERLKGAVGGGVGPRDYALAHSLGTQNKVNQHAPHMYSTYSNQDGDWLRAYIERRWDGADARELYGAVRFVVPSVDQMQINQDAAGVVKSAISNAARRQASSALLEYLSGEPHVAKGTAQALRSALLALAAGDGDDEDAEGDQGEGKEEDEGEEGEGDQAVLQDEAEEEEDDVQDEAGGKQDFEKSRAVGHGVEWSADTRAQRAEWVGVEPRTDEEPLGLMRRIADAEAKALSKSLAMVRKNPTKLGSLFVSLSALPARTAAKFGDWCRTSAARGDALRPTVARLLEFFGVETADDTASKLGRDFPWILHSGGLKGKMKRDKGAASGLYLRLAATLVETVHVTAPVSANVTYTMVTKGLPLLRLFAGMAPTLLAGGLREAEEGGALHVRVRATHVDDAWLNIQPMLGPKCYGIGDWLKLVPGLFMRRAGGDKQGARGALVLDGASVGGRTILVQSAALDGDTERYRVHKRLFGGAVAFLRHGRASATWRPALQARATDAWVMMRHMDVHLKDIKQDDVAAHAEHCGTCFVYGAQQRCVQNTSVVVANRWSDTGVLESLLPTQSSDASRREALRAPGAGKVPTGSVSAVAAARSFAASLIKDGSDDDLGKVCVVGIDPGRGDLVVATLVLCDLGDDAEPQVLCAMRVASSEYKAGAGHKRLNTATRRAMHTPAYTNAAAALAAALAEGAHGPPDAADERRAVRAVLDGNTQVRRARRERPRAQRRWTDDFVDDVYAQVPVGYRMVIVCGSAKFPVQQRGRGRGGTASTFVFQRDIARTALVVSMSEMLTSAVSYCCHERWERDMSRRGDRWYKCANERCQFRPVDSVHKDFSASYNMAALFIHYVRHLRGGNDAAAIRPLHFTRVNRIVVKARQAAAKPAARGPGGGGGRPGGGGGGGGGGGAGGGGAGGGGKRKRGKTSRNNSPKRRRGVSRQGPAGATGSSSTAVATGVEGTRRSSRKRKATERYEPEQGSVPRKPRTGVG